MLWVCNGASDHCTWTHKCVSTPPTTTYQALTYIASRLEEKLFPRVHHLFRQAQLVAALEGGLHGVGRPGLHGGAGGGGEPLPDHVLVQPRLLLQLGDDVAGRHAHANVDGHADTSEERCLDADDVMRDLEENGGGWS